MFRQIKHLTKVQLCNFLNINVIRYTKDRQKKRGMTVLLGIWGVLFLMLFSYIGALSYGYIKIGLGNVLPMYLIAVSGLIILLFSVFKAGSVIFQKNSYEMLCSLPLPQSAIVISRFLSMYLGNMLLSLGVMISGMAVYAYFMKPDYTFYLFGVVGTIFIPLLPITIATLLGAMITAISSRMKHKSIVGAALSVLLLMGIMFGTSKLANVEGNISKEMLQNLSETVLSLLEKIYPPAIWLGTAMVDGNIGNGIIYFGSSILLFIIMVVIVSTNFQKICQRLYGITAKHNYQMETLKKNSVLEALYKKELKRYFASGVYMTNTIIGPIMMVIFAITILVMGIDKIEQVLPVKGEIAGLMPFALALTVCIMPITSTSISMEGKEWWIVSSLPVRAKTIFDSKILMNLTIVTPFYLIAEILMILALKPGIMDTVWLLMLPAIFILFSCVYGITVNLKFPLLKWENEVTVVKQSTAAMLGTFGTIIVILICAVPVIFVTQISSDYLKLLIAIVISVVTAYLYRKNARTDLQKLEV